MNPIDNTLVIRSPHGHSTRLRAYTDGRLILLDTELVPSRVSP